MTAKDKITALLEQYNDQTLTLPLTETKTEENATTTTTTTITVVTNKQIADALSVKPSTVRAFVSTHKDTLLVGTHYFVLKPQDVPDNIPVNRFANSVALWTAVGAFHYATLKDQQTATKTVKKPSVKITTVNPVIPAPTIWQDQLVLTTEQLANFYGTTTNVIKNNFNNNRDKFIEGKHFFKLYGDDLRNFKCEVKNLDLVPDRTPSLYLWTKRGALRLCKSVGTDKAWEVFELLEDNYFNKQSETVTMETFNSVTLQINEVTDQLALSVIAERNIEQQLAQQKRQTHYLAKQRKDLYQ